MLIHFEVSSAAYKRKSVMEILTKHVRSNQEREYIMKRMVESIFLKKFRIFMVMFVVCFFGSFKHPVFFDLLFQSLTTAKRKGNLV